MCIVTKSCHKEHMARILSKCDVNYTLKAFKLMEGTPAISLLTSLAITV